MAEHTVNIAVLPVVPKIKPENIYFWHTLLREESQHLKTKHGTSILSLVRRKCSYIN
jgi:hypothetical protein